MNINIGILLLVMPFIIEALIETLKMCAVKGEDGKFRPNWGFLWKIGVAVLLCYASGFDLVALLGVSLKFTIGILATGILCGRGANFVHELYKRIAGTSPGSGSNLADLLQMAIAAGASAAGVPVLAELKEGGAVPPDAAGIHRSTPEDEQGDGAVSREQDAEG